MLIPIRNQSGKIYFLLFENTYKTFYINFLQGMIWNIKAIVLSALFMTSISLISGTSFGQLAPLNEH